MREWYKDGPYWRHNESSNAGDLIFNTCDKIIRDGDTSEWAFNALLYCLDLLLVGKRWPDSLTQADTSKTWIRYKWSKLLKNGRYSRPQHILTRDPYTAFYAACAMVAPVLIGDVQPVWYIYRSNFFNWWRYLCTGNVKYLRRYLFWDMFSTSNKPYVIRLRELRSLAINKLKT